MGDADMVLRGSGSEVAWHCLLTELAFSQAFRQRPFPGAGGWHKRSGMIRNVSANASRPA